MGENLTGYPSIDKPWLKYYNSDATWYVTERLKQSAYQYIVTENKNRKHYTALEYLSMKITYLEWR